MTPFPLFAEWYAQAQQSEPRDANAIALATTAADGAPHVRYVLFQRFDEDGFTVYTNTGSMKGEDLAANPRAAFAIHWKSNYRQVRVEGAVERVSDEEADAYFASRNRDKQLSAAASRQSRPLPSRETFLNEVERLDEAHAGEDIPRPDHWTGYLIRPDRFEFWEGREDRMHHRQLFELQADGSWTETLLYP